LTGGETKKKFRGKIFAFWRQVPRMRRVRKRARGRKMEGGKEGRMEGGGRQDRRSQHAH
jgi:hypothetical protein